MKLDLNQVLVDHDRNPVKELIPTPEGEPTQTRVLTLGILLRQTILGSCTGDDQPNSDDKMMRYKMSLDMEKPDFDLGISELAMLKKCIENRDPQLLPWLFGQVMLLLDGKETGI